MITRNEADEILTYISMNVNTEDETEKTNYLKQYVADLKQHIIELGNKLDKGLDKKNEIK